MMQKKPKVLHLKIRHHLSTALKKINVIQIDNADDLDVVMLAQIQQKLQKNNRKFVELLQR